MFFGEPEIDTADFFVRRPTVEGLVSLLELPGGAGQAGVVPHLPMWLLADLFQGLPEVGDIDKAQASVLLRRGAPALQRRSKDFVDSITQTVSTYPTSGYDLGKVLTELAIGEAIVTVMNDRGAPSPVGWTRPRAPQGPMDPTPADQITVSVNGSSLLATYGTAVDRESAREILGKKLEASAVAAEQERAAEAADEQTEKLRKEAERATRKPAPHARTSNRQSTTEKVMNEAGRTIAREIVRGIFKTGRRR